MTLSIRAHKRLRDFTLDLELEAGEGVTLIAGPNGSGKTTLLRLIAGLEHLDAGLIAIGDRTIAQAPGTQPQPRDRDVALLFQSFALFEHLTVERNVAFGLEARRVARPVLNERVAGMLAKLDLVSLASRFPSGLSGGERQRTALARALVLSPSVLLLDEPFASLDLQTRLRARRTVARTLAALRIPSLLVSHDPADAEAFPERIVMVEAGAITARGSLAELSANPPTPFVADFMAGVPRQGPGGRATNAAFAPISEE